MWSRHLRDSKDFSSTFKVTAIISLVNHFIFYDQPNPSWKHHALFCLHFLYRSPESSPTRLFFLGPSIWSRDSWRNQEVFPPSVPLPLQSCLWIPMFNLPILRCSYFSYPWSIFVPIVIYRHCLSRSEAKCVYLCIRRSVTHPPAACCSRVSSPGGGPRILPPSIKAEYNISSLSNSWVLCFPVLPHERKYMVIPIAKWRWYLRRRSR